MSAEAAGKVTGAHLTRAAYLYVRQSTLRQVLTNTESAARQYALRQRAIALGWPAGQGITIDTDQGQSGASAADREGFQRLVAEVGMGRAGIVLGLEVSRLARNSSAGAVVQEYNAVGLLFPVRVRTGDRKGDLAWMPLQHWRVLRTLHNPRYAGAFAYGRRRERIGANGKKTFETLPRDQWIA